MKNKFLFSITAAVLVCASLHAAIPSYVTKSQTNTTQATVIFPYDPNSQIRLLSVFASSDLTSSKLTCYVGGTSHYCNIAETNTALTNIFVESTNGFVAGQLLYIHGLTNDMIATNSSMPSATNIVLTTSIGIAKYQGMEIECMTTNVPTLAIGGFTNKVIASDAIWVGNYGRAMVLSVNGTAACSIDSASVKYDSN